MKSLDLLFREFDTVYFLLVAYKLCLAEAVAILQSTQEV